MQQLFVYGIFLDAANRWEYGMTNPRYDTVADYLTVGGRIVQAMYVPEAGLSLTGLLVQLPEDYDWTALDLLESGYDRITVTTNSNKQAYMYVRPERSSYGNSQ